MEVDKHNGERKKVSERETLWVEINTPTTVLQKKELNMHQLGLQVETEKKNVPFEIWKCQDLHFLSFASPYIAA